MSSLTFASTPVGQSTAAQSVTLSNTGTAALTLSGVVLSDTTDYSMSGSCGTSVGAGSTCSLLVTFTPHSAASLPATITFTDNSGGTSATQVLTLSGTGTGTPPTTSTSTLYAFPESDNSVTPLYALVNGATKTIDMTMYALEDATFSGDLVAACKRGVTVRVILDQNDEKNGNTPAYNQLNAQANCSAVWANTAFEATHEKAFIIDGKTVAIMSLNLQSQYYSTTRDFALVEQDANDIAAIQATFNADYAAGTPSNGVAGASDFSFVPPLGDDLIWSPTTAQAAMLGLINNATATLLIENEEMGASNIVSALQSACQRGVTVHIAMVNQSSYASQFQSLISSGCRVNVYPDTSTGFYIHAKAVIADYGLSTQKVYMGSINYSNASMNNNRELGLYITDPASIQVLYTSMSADYAGGTLY